MDSGGEGRMFRGNGRLKKGEKVYKGFHGDNTRKMKEKFEYCKRIRKVREGYLEEGTED